MRSHRLVLAMAAGAQKRGGTLRVAYDMISGSPFYQVAQSWMKDYVYNSEWKVLSCEPTSSGG